MMKLLRFFFFCFFAGIFFPTQAQIIRAIPDLVTRNEHLAIQSLDIEPGIGYAFSYSRPFSAIAVKAPLEFFDSQAYLVLNADTFPLQRDIHIDPLEGLYSSILVLPSEDFSSLSLINDQFSGEILFHLLYADGLPSLDLSRYRTEDGSCDEPMSVPQSVWREGLPAPSYTRGFTEVRHMVVHHSAGSNTDTDYTRVVRNIYIFHTQSNGWSDMGYNYLIAQDGTIFDGRDPLDGPQDEVVGAHFCGRNANTMGVCLLGTYSQLAPPVPALRSLIQLFTWKAAKDNLDPTAFLAHPANPSLGVIAGHRNGCATECPGQQTFNRLDSLRQEVDMQVLTCTTGGLRARMQWDRSRILQGQSVRVSDLSIGEVTERLWFFPGASSVEFSDAGQTAQVSYEERGQYDLGLKVIGEESTDSIYFPGAIHVLQPVSADFSGNPRVVIEGEQVSFTDLSTGDIESWQWSFSSSQTSSESSPQPVIYLRPGWYSVSLKVSNGLSEDEIRKQEYIQVLPKPQQILQVRGNPLERGDNVKVQVDERQDLQYAYALNMHGQAFALRQGARLGEVQELETAHLAAGIYILVIASEREVYQSKIVIR